MAGRVNGRAIWRDLRCGAKDCSRLLARAYLYPGSRVNIRCPRCGQMNDFRLTPGMEQVALDTNVDSRTMGDDRSG